MTKYILEMAQPYDIEILRGNLHKADHVSTFEFATTGERDEGERRLRIAYPLAQFRRLTLTAEREP